MAITDHTTDTGTASETAATPPWQGINHLALLTADMDATVRFYVGVLGMELVAAVMAGQARHYFFRMGESNTVAFFEWPGHVITAKGAGAPPPPHLQLDHISFNLPDETAVLALRDRLEAAGCGVTPVVNHSIVNSIYFSDNNGIALEASWWVADATAPDANRDDFLIDPNPVPAIAELREHGRVLSTPKTELT